ncbi:MAG: hypothetical protein GY754_33555 [bacterium]|nr:hypothetical protein [bacterium]
MAKATSLLKAYQAGAIPHGGGFIISAYFQPGTTYGIYEITAYRNVKDIFPSDDGLNFRTDGNRTHILVEPASFSKKHMEPVHREGDKGIPYRFNELEILQGKKAEKIMIGKEPQLIHSSFTIIDHEGDSFAFVFHPTEDVYIAIKKFLADSLYNDCGLSKNGAKEAATLVLGTIKKFSIWDG